MEKNLIRDIVNNKLKNINKEYIDSNSESIYFNLINSKLLNNKKNIMFYINKDNEVKTDIYLDKFLNKNIFLPKIENNNIKIGKYTNKDSLIIGKYKIREPKETVENINLDVVIVPLKAIDRNGNRVGHGKGYYDRFLKNLNVLKIGLCYDFQIFDKIEADTFDIKLDYIITNKEIIKIENN